MSRLFLFTMLASCGGGVYPRESADSRPGSLDPTASAPPSTPLPSGDMVLKALTNAAQRSIDAGTAHVSYTFETKGSMTIPDGMVFSGTGQSSLGLPPRLRMSVVTDVFEGSHEMIIDDHTLYITGDLISDRVDPGTWLSVDLDSVDAEATSLIELGTARNEAYQGLYYLFGAVGSAGIEDGGSIAGQSTSKYDARIELTAIGDRVPESVQRVIDDDIAGLVRMGEPTTYEASAWINSDGFVVRSVYTFDVATAGGGEQIFTYSYTDYGSPLELGLPNEAVVVPFEDVIE